MRKQSQCHALARSVLRLVPGFLVVPRAPRAVVALLCCFSFCIRRIRESQVDAGPCCHYVNRFAAYPLILYSISRRKRGPCLAVRFASGQSVQHGVYLNVATRVDTYAGPRVLHQCLTFTPLSGPTASRKWVKAVICLALVSRRGSAALWASDADFQFVATKRATPRAKLSPARARKRTPCCTAGHALAPAAPTSRRRRCHAWCTAWHAASRTCLCGGGANCARARVTRPPRSRTASKSRLFGRRNGDGRTRRNRKPG